MCTYMHMCVCMYFLRHHLVLSGFELPVVWPHTFILPQHISRQPDKFLMFQLPILGPASASPVLGLHAPWHRVHNIFKVFWDTWSSFLLSLQIWHGPFTKLSTSQLTWNDRSICSYSTYRSIIVHNIHSWRPRFPQLYFIVFPSILRIEPWASHILSKHSALSHAPSPSLVDLRQVLLNLRALSLIILYFETGSH